MPDNTVKFRIRGHHLLCIQGFQGDGYSPEFTNRMKAIVNYLKKNPDTRIEVVAGADDICVACPHQYRGRCTMDDPEDTPIFFDTPDNAVKSDHRVLSWLEIEDNSVQLWGQILYKIGRLVDSSALDALCQDCRWRGENYCEKALDDLHDKVSKGEILFEVDFRNQMNE